MTEQRPRARPRTLGEVGTSRSSPSLLGSPRRASSEEPQRQTPSPRGAGARLTNLSPQRRSSDRLPLPPPNASPRGPVSPSAAPIPRAAPEIPFDPALLQAQIERQEKQIQRLNEEREAAFKSIQRHRDELTALAEGTSVLLEPNGAGEKADVAFAAEMRKMADALQRARADLVRERASIQEQVAAAVEKERQAVRAAAPVVVQIPAVAIPAKGRPPLNKQESNSELTDNATDSPRTPTQATFTNGANDAPRATPEAKRAPETDRLETSLPELSVERERPTPERARDIPPRPRPLVHASSEILSESTFSRENRMSMGAGVSVGDGISGPVAKTPPSPSVATTPLAGRGLAARGRSTSNLGDELPATTGTPRKTSGSFARKALGPEALGPGRERRRSIAVTLFGSAKPSPTGTPPEPAVDKESMQHVAKFRSIMAQLRQASEEPPEEPAAGPVRKTVISETEKAFWDEDGDSIILHPPAKGVCNVHAGSLNKLVECVAEFQHGEKALDREEFFRVYSLFATAEVLLLCIMNRYRVPEVSTGHAAFDAMVRKKVVDPIKLRCLAVLRYWIERGDLEMFQNESVMTTLRTFLTTEVAAQHANLFKNLVSLIETKEIDVRVALENKKLLHLEAMLKPQASDARTFEQLSEALLVLDPDIVAEQLCHYAFNHYRKLERSEFRWQGWQSPELAHLSPNICKMISFFNCLGGAISTAVLRRDQPSERAKCLTWFIRAAQSCRVHGNFDTMMAIMAPMNSTAIKRLKKTWLMVNKREVKTLATLNELMLSKNSFANFRVALKSWTGPCVPFLGMSLSDITFIEYGNQDRINGLINYTKASLIGSAIEEALKFQASPYSVDQISEIQQLISSLLTAKHFDDDRLFAMSYAYEPREVVARSQSTSDLKPAPTSPD